MAESFADDSKATTVLVNVFTVDPKDHEAFKIAWAKGAAFFKAQPGYISAQLHQGIGDSTMFVNYAVFENTAALAAATKQPAFGPLRAAYPDSAIAHPHPFQAGTVVFDHDSIDQVIGDLSGRGVEA